MPENPAADGFDGDLETARFRLRNLAEDACKVLDARLLNILSYHLAAYMDGTAGSRSLVSGMMAEISAERQRRHG